jgi:hypothetical protein
VTQGRGKPGDHGEKRGTVRENVTDFSSADFGVKFYATTAHEKGRGSEGPSASLYAYLSQVERSPGSFAGFDVDIDW